MTRNEQAVRGLSATRDCQLPGSPKDFGATLRTCVSPPVTHAPADFLHSCRSAEFTRRTCAVIFIRDISANHWRK
jgi:hypothetical protein